MRTPIIVRSPLIAALGTAASIAWSAACGTAGARFTTKLASDFTSARHTVSVLGVYKDGQMSSEAWDTVALPISRSLGANHCDAAYGEALLTANGVLSSAIDDYARSNGPTDELLAQLAPAAKGDLVLVMTIAGKLPVKTKDSLVGGSSTPTPSLGGGGQGGGMGGRGRGAAPVRRSQSGGEDTNELDMSASLFSVHQGRSVALFEMQYSGDSVDDAIAQFSAQLARSLPGVQCSGWNWDAKVDAQRIRQSVDQ